jgi:hypothetical protein
MSKTTRMWIMLVFMFADVEKTEKLLLHTERDLGNNDILEECEVLKACILHTRGFEISLLRWLCVTETIRRDGGDGLLARMVTRHPTEIYHQLVAVKYDSRT